MPSLRTIYFSASAEKNFALDTAKGLYFLHSKSVLDGNLTSSNVMVNADEKAKLSDFGLARTRSSSIKSMHEKSEDFQWQAPECAEPGDNYSRYSQVYSYEVVLWEIVTKKTI